MKALKLMSRYPITPTGLLEYEHSKAVLDSTSSQVSGAS